MSAMMEYMTGKDESEVGLLKAQIEHMGGALEREISLCAQADAESKHLRDELRKARFANEKLATEVLELKAILQQCREHVTPELVNAIDDAA